MKTSFIAFCKRNYAFLKLAIVSNLEYRLNFLADTFIQPFVAGLIEIVLWQAIFTSSHLTELGGFSKEYYMGYYIWAAFISRITANWMYEFRMIEEIASGNINSLLIRPTTYFEYYFSQFFGYKSLIIITSLILPYSLSLFLNYPVYLDKLFWSILLILFYLVFTYLISFIVATFAFHLTRVHSFTMAKNLALFLFTGELIPLDLIQEPYKSFFMNTPFTAAVYLPVGYLTGRIEFMVFAKGFYLVGLGILILTPIAIFCWSKGKEAYVGTGA